MALRVLLGLLACVALAAPAAAVADVGAAVDHVDPRSKLPDKLVVEPVERAADVSSGLPETWCGAETTDNDTQHAVHAATVPQLKLLYVIASDQTNRFADLDDRLQANVSLLGRYMGSQSGGAKHLRWDMGTPCGPEYVDVQVLRLPRTLATYVPDGWPDFQLLSDDVTAALGTTTPRNYVVYADGFYGSSGVAGTAWQYADSSPTTTVHDDGRLVAAVFGPETLPSNGYAWPSVMLHEILHNLGAVQSDAPHASAAGHCTDEHDVMCYKDGQSVVLSYPCGTIAGIVAETLDCNGDDYFSPSPAGGSYLASHWNVFNSAHLDACSAQPVACGVEAAADVTAPSNLTPAAPTTWRSSAWSVTLAGADDGSGVEAFEWRVNGGAVQQGADATVGEHGEHLFETRVGDRAGNWSPWRAETVRVDLRAPGAGVECAPAGDGRHTCLARASDAGSGLASVQVVRDGSVAETVAAGATFEVVGPATVAVRAIDGVGHASTSSLVSLPGAAAVTPEAGIDAGLVSRTTRRTTLRGRGRRVLARGVLHVVSDTLGRRARVRLRTARLRTGTWRLRVCIRRRCAVRTVHVRPGSRRRTLRMRAPVRMRRVRARFDVQRRHAGRVRTFTRRVTSTRL